MKDKIIKIARDVIIYFVIVLILFWAVEKMGWLSDSKISVFERALLTTVGWHIGKIIVCICRKKFGKKN